MNDQFQNSAHCPLITANYLNLCFFLNSLRELPKFKTHTLGMHLKLWTYFEWHPGCFTKQCDENNRV